MMSLRYLVSLQTFESGTDEAPRDVFASSLSLSTCFSTASTGLCL